METATSRRFPRLKQEQAVETSYKSSFPSNKTSTVCMTAILQAMMMKLVLGQNLTHLSKNPTNSC